MRNDLVLTVSKARMRGVRIHDQPYINRSDVIAWLRNCALESGDNIPGRTAAELATALERMEVAHADH